MEDLTDCCCICLQNAIMLTMLDQKDLDNIKYIKKLVLCVPNETWKADYQICNPCISQLDIAYKFVQCCIESEKFRKKDLEQRNLKTREKKFTCDDCGKSFRQKKYLGQHITKLHINKRKQETNKNEFSEDPIVEIAVKEQDNFNDDNIKPEVNVISIKKDDDQNKENTENILDEKPNIKNDYYKVVKPELCDTQDLKDIADFEVDDDNRDDSTYSEKSDSDNEFEETEEKRKRTLKRKSNKREPQKCNFCIEIFKKRQDLMMHIRTQHSTEKPFSCDQCDAKYMNRYSLLIHSRKHTNEKPFICATCGKSFVSSADLNHHTKIHNKDRAYPCPICDRSFKTHSNLRTHRLQMHLDPADWKFPCNLCDKKFPIRGNLIKHLKRHAGIKEFMCHICDKKFLNKAELTLHLNTHTNQRLFKCNFCSKDYKNREGLRRHMKVVHDQGNWKAPKIEKKYLCPMCPKIFAFGNKLQRHIFTHTGEKPFKCDYCQKRFIDKYGRKVHYKKDHNIEYVGDDNKDF